MSLEVIFKYRRAVYPVPLVKFPFKTTIYFHVERAAMIAEPIFDGIVVCSVCLVLRLVD